MKRAYVYPQFTHQAGTMCLLIDKMNCLAEKEGYKIVILTFEQGAHPILYIVFES